MQEDELWRRYKKDPSVQNRNTIVLRYLSFMKRVITSYRNASGCPLEAEELLGAAFLGLLDAIRSFNVNRKLAFSTHAGFRIRGSIKSYLRDLSSQRSKFILAFQSRMDKSTDLYLCDHDYIDHPVIAERLSISQAVYDKHNRRTLEIALPFSELSQNLEENIEFADNTLNPLRMVVQTDEWDFLTRGLDKRTKLLLYGIYVQDKTVAELSEEIGVSKSMASRIHTAALRFIRERLDNRCTA